MIEVAFIRFYTSRVFITNLPFPRDTQLLLPFHRRPPWLQRDYAIKQNPGLRTEYLSMYQLNAIRHVGRVATWGSGFSSLRIDEGVWGPLQLTGPFGPVKLLLFTCKVEVSIVLHLTWLNYQLMKQNGVARTRALENLISGPKRF